MKSSLTDGLSLELERSSPDVVDMIASQLADQLGDLAGQLGQPLAAPKPSAKKTPTPAGAPLHEAAASLESSGLELDLGLAPAPVQPMMPEEVVPTSVVDRRKPAPIPTPIVQDLAQPTHTLGTIGPYSLIRELVRGPSAWMIEALDKSGATIMLQVARLRAVRSNAELFERQYFEQMIAETTAALSSEPDVQVIAHGGADRTDGTRVLFWVLPWRDGARELARASERIISASHLVSVGLALAKRLVRRHALGRLEPLLSEHLVLVPSDGVGAQLVGVPIYLAPQWLEAEMLMSRLSPEEHLTTSPREVGDIWRLGQTISALAAGLGSIPAPLRAVIDDLTHPDPSRRIKRATDAVVELEAVEAALTVHVELHVEPPPAAELGAATVDLAALSPDMFNSLLRASAGDSTRMETALPAGLLRDLATAAAEDPAERPVGDDEVAPHILAELQSAAELEARLAPPIPLAVNSDGAVAMTPGLEHAFTTIDQSPPTAVFEVPNHVKRRRAEPPRLFTHDEEEPTMIPKEPFPPPPVVDEAPTSPGTIQAIASLASKSGIERSEALEGTPNPSPWSEVPPGIGIEPGSQDRVAAFTEALPSPEQTPQDGVFSRTDDLEPELMKDALPMAAWQRAIIAVAAVLGAFTIAFVASRVLFRDGREVASVVTAANEVIVDSDPSDAVVVAEADGKVLGRTPMAFLVPAGSNASVLVLQRGYEPQRILLPERGRIATTLSKMDESQSCEVALASDVAIEGVDVYVDRPEQARIPGAAVIRAKSGQTKTGAWIIRCNELAGKKALALDARLPPEKAELELVGASGARVIVDGYPAGEMPAKRLVSGAFASIRVEGAEERFVPTRPTLKIDLK